MHRTRVFVPGSIGNVGPGLDILGLALTGAGDTVTAERFSGRGIVVLEPGHPDLPRSPARHATAIAARAALRMAGSRGRFGIRLRVEKGLPLSGGQGGSAASAVAGAVAANRLAGRPLATPDLLRAALAAEAVVAGRHLDNIAPSLLGGLVLISSTDPPDVIRLEPPAGLVVVLATPGYQLATRRGRSVLPRTVTRDVALAQAASVATMVAAAEGNDVERFGRAIQDRIAEPARARLLPGFEAVKRAALRAGALGCSISGSGPTVFAVTASQAGAERIGAAMRRAYGRLGIASAIRIARPDRRGARPR